VRIRRLRLVNFKRFADHEIVLEPGLNLVVGPNEAGKSSIVEALSTVLFADPGHRDGVVRALEKWGSTGGMRLELDFEQGDDSYRLTKDFGAGTAELAHRNSGDNVTDLSEINSAVSELVGFDTREAFESIAAVRQGELGSLEGSEGELRRGALVPLIERKMTSSSGRVDAARVIEQLDARIERLRIGLDKPAKHPGPLKHLQDRRDELLPRAAVMRKRLDEVQRQRSALAREREELTNAKREFDGIEEQYLNEEARKGHREELGRLRTVFDERAAKINRVRQLRSDVTEAWATLVQGSREHEKDAIAAKAALDASDERIAALEAATPGGENPLEQRPGIMLGAVGAAALAMIVVPLLTNLAAPVKWSTVAAGGSVGVWSFFLFRRASKIWAAAQEVRNVLSERKKREVALSAALLKLGVKTYEGLEDYAEQQDKARRNIDIWNTMLAEVCKGNDPDTIERQLEAEVSTLETRVLELEGALREPGAAGGVATAVDVSQLQSEREELSNVVSELTERVKRREMKLEGAEVDETLPDIEAELERIDREIRGLERHLRVLGLTRDSLQKAMASANEEAATVLEPIVGKFLSRATLGRYTHVTVADDLHLSVASPSGMPSAPERMDTTDLSTGTFDQLYFATRYALLEFLSPGDGSPLILDDALVHWDPNRRSATLELLDEVSDKRQVLLFTCEGHGSEFADSLVLLPGA
jgi:uncharacterized protein YhaN